MVWCRANVRLRALWPGIAEILAGMYEGGVNGPRDPASVLALEFYGVRLDLSSASGRFRSDTVVGFRCREPGVASTRVVLPGLAERNVLEVKSVGAYAVEGRGMRCVVAAEGDAYVYSMCLPRHASQIFCCFDDPRLRAPATVSMCVPTGWTCLANAPVRSEPSAANPAVG